MEPWFLLLALALGIVGHLVGKEKGYPIWGFFMGLILGVLGIIILCFTKPRKM